MSGDHSIRFGDGEVSFRAPVGWRVERVRRPIRRGEPAEAELVALAVGRGLEEFLTGSRRTLVVVNDATRSTPTARMLSTIRQELELPAAVRVIVATGLHRPPAAGEIARLCGDVDGGWELTAHDASDTSQLVSVDVGEEAVALNAAVMEADRVVILTSVEPHFFAGFTGGWKSIIPGLADFETVKRSHSYAVSELATPMQTALNPVRDYMDSTANCAMRDTPTYAIQAVLDGDGLIAACRAGDVDISFKAACRDAVEWHGIPVAGDFDVVVAVMWPPLDGDLYQLQKAWENSASVVVDGGTCIAVGCCEGGIGAGFYAERLDENPDVAGWAVAAGQPYEMGVHKLVRVARFVATKRLFAVTAMETSDVERAGYASYRELQEAVDVACAGRSDGRMLIVDDAGVTVPVVV